MEKTTRPITFSEMCLILERYKIMLQEEPERYTTEQFLEQEDFRRKLFLKG